MSTAKRKPTQPQRSTAAHAELRELLKRASRAANSRQMLQVRGAMDGDKLFDIVHKHGHLNKLGCGSPHLEMAWMLAALAESLGIPLEAVGGWSVNPGDLDEFLHCSGYIDPTNLEAYARELRTMGRVPDGTPKTARELSALTQDVMARAFKLSTNPAKLKALKRRKTSNEIDASIRLFVGLKMVLCALAANDD